MRGRLLSQDRAVWLERLVDELLPSLRRIEPIFLLIIIGMMTLLVYFPLRVQTYAPSWNNTPQEFKDVLRKIAVYEEVPSFSGHWKRMTWNNLYDDPRLLPKVVRTGCSSNLEVFLGPPQFSCKIIDFVYDENWDAVNASGHGLYGVFVDIEYGNGGATYKQGFYVHLSLSGTYAKKVTLDQNSTNNLSSYVPISKLTYPYQGLGSNSTGRPVASDLFMYFGGKFKLSSGMFASPYGSPDGSCSNDAAPKEVQAQLQQLRIWTFNTATNLPNKTDGTPWTIPFDFNHCKLLSKSQWNGSEWNSYIFGLRGDEAEYVRDDFNQAWISIAYNANLGYYANIQVRMTGWLPLCLYKNEEDLMSNKTLLCKPQQGWYHDMPIADLSNRATWNRTNIVTSVVTFQAPRIEPSMLRASPNNLEKMRIIQPQSQENGAWAPPLLTIPSGCKRSGGTPRFASNSISWNGLIYT